MTYAARLALTLRPASLALYHAARLAADCAANDNAGAAWAARDEAPAVDDCPVATLVMGRTVAAIFAELAPEVDCTAWRLSLSSLGARRALRFVPARPHCSASLRQERVFRALARAAGIEVF